MYDTQQNNASYELLPFLHLSVLVRKATDPHNNGSGIHPTVNCVGNRALPHAMCAASCVAKTHTLLEGLEAETLLHSGFENPLHLSSMKMMAPPHW